MEQRPKIKLQLSGTDRVLEISGWIIFAVLCVYITWSYFTLPNTIPVHFNGKGEPDNYGSKGAIVILPCIAVFVMMLLTVINQYPHIFNYPQKITAENAERQYTLATRLIRFIKLTILTVFLMSAIEMVQSAKGNSWLGPLLIPVILIATALPLVWYFVSARKNM